MKEIYEYEHGLPEYLQHDLDMYKEGLRTNSNLYRKGKITVLLI